MKAIAYCRLSSLDQVEGTSLESQQHQIIQYCQAHGIDLIRTFTDPGVSGGLPLAKRPAGQQVIEVLAKGEAQAFLITKLDRAFRSASDALVNVEQWEKQGIALHVLSVQGMALDTASPLGQFFLTTLAAVGELEKNLIRERCAEGRRVRKAAGQRVGEIGFGFNLAADGRTLIPNETEQEAIRLIVSLHKSGHSLRAIAAELEKRGVPSKKNGHWSHKQVASILRNCA